MELQRRRGAARKQNRRRHASQLAIRTACLICVGAPVDPSSISAHDRVAAAVATAVCMATRGRCASLGSLTSSWAQMLRTATGARKRRRPFDPRLDDGCDKLRLFTAHDIASCLRRRPARVAEDSLEEEESRRTARCRECPHGAAVHVQPHLTSPALLIHRMDCASVACRAVCGEEQRPAAAWRLDHTPFGDKGLAVFDRGHVQHARRSSPRLRLRTLHVSPKVVQDLPGLLRIHAPCDVAGRRRGVRADGQWTTAARVYLHLRKMCPPSRHASAPPGIASGDRSAGAIAAVKTLLDENAVPVYDAWRHTVDALSAAPVAGGTFRPGSSTGKGPAQSSTACALGTACSSPHEALP